MSADLEITGPRFTDTATIDTATIDTATMDPPTTDAAEAAMDEETATPALAEDSPQYRAWVYLRRVIEASRLDVLELLWPDGWQGREEQPPVDPVRVATRILQRDPKLPEGLLQATAQRYRCDPRKDIERARSTGLRLVVPGTPEWPAQLTNSFVHMGEDGLGPDSTVRGLAAAPFALWVSGRGRLNRVAAASVALVGTRAPGAYGTTVAEDFSGALSLAGYAVVSGGAVGIDRAAHEGVLRTGGSTVVVLANGADVAYPRAHDGLFAAVKRAGLVVSEYPPGVTPARHRFLTRNRIVAALSQATVIVQAPARSGALNTANWAEAMCKPVMAVPGPVTSAGFVGCLTRIKDQRALLVSSAEDIREHLEPLGTSRCVQEELPFSEGVNARTGGGILTLTDMTVFDACAVTSSGGGALADIQAETSLPGRVVIRVLRDLERRGIVVREGSRWLKVPGAVDSPAG